MTPFHCTFKFFYPFVQTCEIGHNTFPISHKNEDPSPLQVQKNNRMKYDSHTKWVSYQSANIRCSIMLHVNCKIAVFVNFQVLTMAKMDTKVKNQVLTNIFHCLVDRKMVLRAQELAPSGIMLVILSLKCKYLQAKQSFQILAPKRVCPRP